MTLEFKKTVQTSKGTAKEAGQRIELHKAAADPRISDEQYLKILRASQVVNSEQQEAAWQPIIDDLKKIENEEPEITIEAAEAIKE